MIPTGNQRIITALYRGQVEPKTELRGYAPQVFHAPTTTANSLFSFFSERKPDSSQRRLLLRERMFDVGVDCLRDLNAEDELDGLLRGLVWVLAMTTGVAVFLKVPMTWQFLVYLLGTVGSLVFLLAVVFVFSVLLLGGIDDE